MKKPARAAKAKDFSLHLREVTMEKLRCGLIVRLSAEDEIFLHIMLWLWQWQAMQQREVPCVVPLPCHAMMTTYTIIIQQMCRPSQAPHLTLSLTLSLSILA
jgi:hypothetical protein